MAKQTSVDTSMDLPVREKSGQPETGQQQNVDLISDDDDLTSDEESTRPFRQGADEIPPKKRKIVD
jgi:hypothetical protein